MISLRQLPFEFEHRPAFSGEDFLVAPCNVDAVNWIDLWPQWSAPALTVYGPAGCGKTHLSRVFLAKSGAVLLTCVDLERGDPPILLGDHRACVIEDVDIQPHQEEQFLHLYNTLLETGRHMLLTASSPPAKWDMILPDLRSRLVAAPACGIGSPDDSLIAAILVKLFSDRQLKVDVDVVSFMLSRMERSFEAARELVRAIDEAALANRRNITVPLVSQVLREREDGPK